MIPLETAGPDAGPKAETLGRLLRAGFPVPPGFVVLPDTDPALGSLPEGVYAVRSSASTEDTTHGSAAGQHDTFLGIARADVADRIAAVRASLWSARAVAYRNDVPARMAVVVQQHIDAEVSGVMFTGEPTEIEASWGLGESVVSGRVTPDAFTVTGDGVIERRLGSKAVRIDRGGTTSVSPANRQRFCLTDDQLLRLRQLGEAVGLDKDIEFCFAGEQLWLLQARPVTAPLEGAAGSPGQATGPARLVHGPADFGRVHPGDILVCRFTDPAWTPLFGVIAGIVTETGGRLSHAAIVARERRIPAVLGIPAVLSTLSDGRRVVVDGSAGTVRPF